MADVTRWLNASTSSRDEEIFVLPGELAKAVAIPGTEGIEKPK